MKRRFLLAAFGLLVLLPGTASATERVLKVLSYNIHHARGVDDVVDISRIAEVIKTSGADLVALQEVDKTVERSGGIDIPAELARLTGFHPLFRKNIDFQGGEYGNAILSRYPILESGNLHYKMLREGEQRGVLHAVVEIQGDRLVFACTHLDYRPDNAERLSNAEELHKLTQSFGDMPVILCGDFNDFPGKELHQKMQTWMTDAWTAGADKGDGFTFSSTDPNRRIDYVYFTRPDRLSVSAGSVLKSQASDHLPLLVTFSFKSSD